MGDSVLDVASCPRCGSPDPARHPAMQFEGEVQPCSHPWHDPAAWSEIKATFVEHWEDLVTSGGRLDPGLVAAELHDYHLLLTEVPKVYDHLTGGRISKPNTLAFHVIEAHDEFWGEGAWGNE